MKRIGTSFTIAVSLFLRFRLWEYNVMDRAEKNIGVELDYIARHLSLLGLPASDPEELNKIKHMVDALRSIAESVQKEAQKHSAFPG